MDKYYQENYILFFIEFYANYKLGILIIDFLLYFKLW